MIKLTLSYLRLKMFEYKIMFYDKVKQPLYCKFFHNGHRCYPRVDLPTEECMKHWHCCKCNPCGTMFDWIELEDKVKIELKKFKKSIDKS